MRLALITTVYRRPRLTNLVLTHYAALAERMKEEFEITIYAAFSRMEDPDFHDLSYFRRLGIRVVFAENEPLSDKWNAVSTIAYQDDPDALIVFGSDDLMNDTLVRLLALQVRYGHDAVTLNNCYFYHPLSRRASLLSDARIGAGRTFSRRLLQHLDGYLWPTGSHIRPDHTQNEHLEQSGHAFHFVNLPDHALPPYKPFRKPVLVDVKTDTNRWPFSDFDPARNPQCEHIVARDLLFDSFPESIAEELWTFSTDQPPGS